MSVFVSFLTDYGTSDGFVAACHGVVARLAPEARIVDITHDVPPGDIRRGALVLAQTLPYLPAGLHVAVVDPGVGTARRGVLVRAGDHVLVGPDNGLLLWAADALGGVVEARELTNRELMPESVSATFHGRDVFAPVVGHLAAEGARVDEVGPPVDPADLVRLPTPVAYVVDDTAHGEVLACDRFGNVQTSLTAAELAELGPSAGDMLNVRTVDGEWDIAFGRTFGDVPVNELVAYVDSAGCLAIAQNGGDAAALLRVRAGELATFTRRKAR